MSKEKQLDKEEIQMLLENVPMFEKLNSTVTKITMVEIKKVLDHIRADVAAIDTNGQTGEQVKLMVSDIIDIYKEEFEEVE